MSQVQLLTEDIELDVGKNYQLLLDTSPKANAKQLNFIRNELIRLYHLNIYYAGFTKDGAIVLRFTPIHGGMRAEQTGITAGALLFALPSILDIVGLILAGAALAYIVFTTPAWVAIILGAGIVLLFSAAFLSGRGGQLKKGVSGAVSGTVSAGKYYAQSAKVTGVAATEVGKTVHEKLRTKSGGSR